MNKHGKLGWPVMGALLLLTGCVAADHTVGQNEQSLGAAAEVVESADPHSRLRDAMPSWDPVVVGAEPLEERLLGPALDRPREIASRFTEAPLSYIGVRANGHSIYRNATADLTVKVNEPLGYWKLIARPQLVPGTFELDAARDATFALFNEFDLPSEQQCDVVESGVAGGSSDSESAIVAQHIRVHRCVNGLRVRGSHLMATYDRSGRAFRVESRWPRFRMAAGATSHSREDALASLAAQLDERLNSGATVGDITVDLAYHFDEEAGTFAPVLSAWVFDEGTAGTPTLAQFSLATGGPLPSLPEPIDG